MTNSYPAQRPHPGAPTERGTILIVVMWIAFGLVTVALLFGNSMMLEYRAANNMTTALEASQAIEGADRYVQYVLTNLEEAGKSPDLSTYESEQAPVGNAAFWLIGRDNNTSASPNKKLTFGLVEESSKLNLNTATQDMLLYLPRMTTQLAASIVDWRDADDETTSNGAESDAYLMQDPKYYCKNAPFETVEELRLVMGADNTILYGEDTNRNGVLDPNEDDGNASPPEDNRNGILEPGLVEYVTVYSHETGQSSQSGQSDQSGQSGQSSQDVKGLVNVNTACAEVLICIPGIGTENANRLISYRQGKTDELDAVSWVADALDQQSATTATPYITTKCYQWTADVAAVGQYGKGFRRTAFVLDTVGGTPAVVFRQDLSNCGWPLGPEIREQLTSTDTRTRK